MYEDQVRSFVDYQTRVALRALDRIPGADVVMMYIEQPDGSGHQFLHDRSPAAFQLPGPQPASARTRIPTKRARYTVRISGRRTAPRMKQCIASSKPPGSMR